jgi:hypothetical protein
VYFTAKRLKLYLWALLIVQVFTCFGFRSSILSGAIDFRTYYTAGSMLRAGQAGELYNLPAEQLKQDQIVAPMPGVLAFFAPPFAALPFVPLSLLPYRSAFWVFLTVNLGLLILTAWVMRPHLPFLAERWPPVPVLLFLSFLPAGLTLIMGQISIMMLFLFCASWLLLARSRALLAGFLLSLALIKFQSTLPVVLLFLLWRQWRFLLGFLAGFSLLATLSIWIVGLRGLAAYLHSLVSVSSTAGTALQSQVGVDPRRMANLYGLFFMLAPTNHIATIATLVASLLLILWAATRRPSFPLALLVALLVSYHLYPCDLTLLLLPISLLCNRLFAEDAALATPAPQTWLQRHRRLILLCSLGVFLISPLMIEIISNNLIFLLALSVLGLVLSPQDWSTLTLAAAPSAQLLAQAQPSPI